jgi:hypothetical protein
LGGGGWMGCAARGGGATGFGVSTEGGIVRGGGGSTGLDVVEGGAGTAACCVEPDAGEGDASCCSSWWTRVSSFARSFRRGSNLFSASMTRAKRSSSFCRRRRDCTQRKKAQIVRMSTQNSMAPQGLDLLAMSSIEKVYRVGLRVRRIMERQFQDRNGEEKREGIRSGAGGRKRVLSRHLVSSQCLGQNLLDR